MQAEGAKVKPMDRYGVTGNFLATLQALYKNVQCSVAINQENTNWFCINNGVKQGCILSPTLFALFIDDLVTDLNDKGLGINCGNCQITTLLYADDIVIVAPTPSALQSLIDVLTQWCITWGIRVNVMKTNIVHFRRKIKSKPRCSHTFKYGSQTITYTAEYKYLGFILDEHLCMEPALSHFTKKAHRALALLNHRTTCIGGFHFDTYSLLFNQLVSSIIMPYACIWGHKVTNKITSIQIQAMRFFLGV